MRKRGSHLLTAGGDVRAEPIVTYTRVGSEEVSSPADGRVEPHFTAVRVDRRGRPHGVHRDDELNDLPLVDAPPSDVSLDPLAEVSAGEIRVVRRRRGPRIAALAGVLAIVAGAGVLAATYGGLTGSDVQPAPAGAQVAALPEAAPEVAQPEAAQPETAAPARSVRIVSTDQIPPYAETAALAPRAAADPVAGEAALSDQATVSGEAALSAEPPGRVIANPPVPRLRPATAGYPQLATEVPAFPANPNATGAFPPQLPAPGDVDNALANVDRILMEQRAASEMSGSGDGAYYDPAQPGVPVGAMPYPMLDPLPPPGAQQAYPVGPAYPAPAFPAEVYGSPAPPMDQYGYPVQQGYPVQDGYPVGDIYGPPPQQLQQQIDLAAGEEEQSPWWLPKRRALVIPNAPIPPASVPQGQSGLW